jgi:hypothetical protein
MNVASMRRHTICRCMSDTHANAADPDAAPDPKDAPKSTPTPALPKEIGGPAGPEPTRYGDWEQKGRCTDF